MSKQLPTYVKFYQLIHKNAILIIGLTLPAGKCLAGHYCLLGSTEQNPIGQSYGDYCTAGHYCPEGTGSPVPCPIGTYLPSTGQSMQVHCIDCALGKYCDTVGQANYTGEAYCTVYLKLYENVTTLQFWCKMNADSDLLSSFQH